MEPGEGGISVEEVGGQAVRCTSAALQVRCRSGHALTDKDYRDVTAPAGAFGLDLRAAFRDWPLNTWN